MKYEMSQHGAIIKNSAENNRQVSSILINGCKDSQIVHKLKRMIQEIKYVEKHNDKFRSLTSRETEIIKLIVAGYNNPQISHQLFISRRTVEQHRKNINRKLEINSLLEIYVFAYAFDLV